MLVTAIMPTANRRRFIPAALACFLAQSWPHKELIVVEDGEDSIADLCQGYGETVRYFRFIEPPARWKLGRKRNAACEHARGELICHWDDDDWSAPSRIADQVQRLISTGKNVTGYRTLLFYRGPTASCSLAAAYRYLGGPRYALGTSLMYRRSWWEGHRFPDVPNGEDNYMVTRAAAADALDNPDGLQMMVARIHDAHTCAKPYGTSQFPPVDLSELPTEFLSVESV